jgi:hypothetical protein
LALPIDLNAKGGIGWRQGRSSKPTTTAPPTTPNIVRQLATVDKRPRHHRAEYIGEAEMFFCANQLGARARHLGRQRWSADKNRPWAFRNLMPDDLNTAPSSLRWS